MKKVGIIGCGAIGSTLAKAIDEGLIDGCFLIALYDVIIEKAKILSLSLNSKPFVSKSFNDFIEHESDIVVEAASQDAVRLFAERILGKGKDLMIMSVGALLDNELFSKILEHARINKRKVLIPSGAIAGLDGLKACKDKLTEVMLITKKNPKSLAGAPYFKEKGIRPEDINEPKVLYKGSARQAVKLFPANVNVAAILSLAGIGADMTKVVVIADPKLKENVHEIHVKGEFGEFNVIMKNKPHPANPKTSYIAVLSAIEMLKSYSSEGIRLGV
jgi:aspartate dehydrogenase